MQQFPTQTGKRGEKYYPWKKFQDPARISTWDLLISSWNLNEVLWKCYLPTLHCHLGPAAQWLECVTSNQKVLSSSPGWILVVSPRIRLLSPLTCSTSHLYLALGNNRLKFINFKLDSVEHIYTKSLVLLIATLGSLAPCVDKPKITIVGEDFNLTI